MVKPSPCQARKAALLLVSLIVLLAMVTRRARQGALLVAPEVPWTGKFLGASSSCSFFEIYYFLCANLKTLVVQHLKRMTAHIAGSGVCATNVF